MKTILFALLALAVLLVVSPAAADCTGRTFSTLGDTSYFYVVNNDAFATATSASIVGHFWQPGDYGTTGEQACNETYWLPPCSGCGGGPIGRTWYLDGTFGQMGCVSGCPAGEMIVALEDTQSSFHDGAAFLVARVNETAGFKTFDYSRLGRNLEFVPIPTPQETVATSGEVFQIHFFIPDPAAGFYGLPGVPASSTITAFYLYSRTSGSSHNRSDWTFVGRYPYAGGVTQGDATLVCPPLGPGVKIAAAIEFDGGQVVTNYVSSSQLVFCDTYQAGAGAVRDGGANGLFVRREASGDLTLSWGPSCSSGDQGFEIYEGTLGNWTSHAPKDCAASSPSTFGAPSFDAYYLVVPYENNYEGSYGVASGGAERPLGSSFCRQRIVNVCPP